MGVKMRHDAHYVEQIATKSRSIGRTIPLTSIYPNPEQPRSEFGDLTELTESIKEKGVLEPLLVKPTDDGKFMIIAGERRWRASQLAGLTEVPCIEMELDEKSVAEIALIENLQRKDLTVWEEADGLAALKEKFGYTQDEIAQKISKGRTTVTELLTIAGLPAQIREKCRAANMNAKAMLLEVARQFDESAMFEYLDNLASGKKKPAAVTAKAKEAGKRPASSSDNGTAKSEVSHAASIFQFVPDDEAFTIEIRFKDPSARTKRGILEALKHAFEKTKESQD
ncbi:MAG TPA: ParB/RepB/Spo0J family partition protein [Pyrinomonadaceae bacterium]|nr:ParB/RepB/Spo0J family partition protein [Pyrinomonadaceae bacterium]